MDKKILDVCCGSRMFWFDKENKDTIFMDKRELEDTLCDGRKLIIKPDIVGDFRNIPFEDKSFKLVVFDPPHLKQVGEKSWLAKKREVEKAFRETFGNGILQNEHCTGIFFYCKDDTDVKGFKRKVRSIFKELNNK